MIKKKAGRPKKDFYNVKFKNINVRLDSQTLSKLVDLCREDDKTKSEMVREIIDFYYGLRHGDEFL